MLFLGILRTVNEKSTEVVHLKMRATYTLHGLFK